MTTGLGPRTWRAAAIVFVSVLVVGLAMSGAVALWGQQVQATTAVKIGTWDTTTPTPTPTQPPEGNPSAGVLESSFGTRGLSDGYFKLFYHLWWGQAPAAEVEFFRDGTSLGKREPTNTSATEQHAEMSVHGLPNGTYRFTCVVRNASGEAPCQTSVTVTVTDANPGMPVLSHDWGNGQVLANLWHGTNATSFRASWNGREVASGQLTANTPNTQVVRVPVGTLGKGRHEFVVVLTNQFGSTTSQTLVVQVP